jgi:hypothetical protein
MIYNTPIGEPSLSQLSISHRRGAHRKDLSSVRNSASAETESAWVATLSNIFENQSEFLRLHLVYTAEASNAGGMG